MLTIPKEIKRLRINRLSLPPAQRYRAKLKSNHMPQFCQQNWYCLVYFQPSQGTSRIHDRSRVRKAIVPRQEADEQGEERRQVSRLQHYESGTQQVHKIWILVLRPDFLSWTQKEAPYREQGAKRPLSLQSVFSFPQQHAMVLTRSDQVILTSKDTQEERWKQALSVLA